MPEQDGQPQDQELDEEFPSGEQPVEEVEGQEAAAEEVIPPEWMGRLKKTQAAEKRIREFAQQHGVTFDDDGNPIHGAAPAYTPPAPVESESDDSADYEAYVADPVAFIKKHNKEAVDRGVREQLGKIVPTLMKSIDETLDPILKSTNSDWDDISADARMFIQDMGFTSMTEAKAFNPKLVDMAILAARGKKNTHAILAAPKRAEQEELRQRRLAAATSGKPAPASTSGSVLTEEQKTEAEELGLSAEEYLRDFSDGPITIGGSK